VIKIGKEEIPQIELLTNLTGHFLPDDSEDWEDMNDIEDGELLDGADLAQYEHSIAEMVEKENLMGTDGKICNLMDYFDGSKSIKGKVDSAIISVKNVDGVLYGCTTLHLKDFLESQELSELCEYITGQYSDGWGEGFEQREIAVDGGTLYVHFWQDRDFHVQTKTQEVETGQPAESASPVRPSLKLLGHDGNIFTIMGDARKLLIRNGKRKEAEEMCRRVSKASDYYNALEIISEYVETELSVPPDRKEKAGKKPKERGESR